MQKPEPSQEADRFDMTAQQMSDERSQHLKKTFTPEMQEYETLQ
jgi:hypothetical protein